jgi:hypothetical protein
MIGIIRSSRRRSNSVPRIFSMASRPFAAVSTRQPLFSVT